MPKKGGKMKVKASEVDSYVEIISMTEIKFEDTKAITVSSPEFKWGEIYQMIRDQIVIDTGLEEISSYQNIKNLRITKATTRPELFSCSEVIKWILPKMNPFTMIISNENGLYFASLTPSYIALAYKFLPSQVMMIDEWLKKVDLDILECEKKMMII